MTTTKYNITQVHRITRKSPTTIRKHLKQGKLTCERDSNGNPLIDASEISRHYKVSVDDFKRANPPSKNPDSEPGGEQSGGQLLASVQQQLDREIEERKRERERFVQQIDELHGVLKRTQDGHERAMRLIEDRSQESDKWKKPLEALESQVANHERDKNEAKKRITQLQNELKREQSKSLFQKLFG